VDQHDSSATSPDELRDSIEEPVGAIEVDVLV